LPDGAAWIDPEFDGGRIVGQVLVPLQEMGEAPEKNSGAPTGDGTNDAEADGLAGRTNVVLMGQGEPLLNLRCNGRRCGFCWMKMAWGYRRNM